MKIRRLRKMCSEEELEHDVKEERKKRKCFLVEDIGFGIYSTSFRVFDDGN